MNELAAFKAAGLPVDLAQFSQALETAQSSIQTANGVPFLKLDKRDGVWRYGADEVDVQDGSLWAINPGSLRKGFISWGKGEVAGKLMRSIMKPPVTQAELSQTGFPWVDCIAFTLLCLNGEDTGVSVEYEQTSYGAMKAYKELLQSLQAQIGTDPAKIVPVVTMTSDSYEHKQYGTIYNPIFTITKWIELSDAAPVVDEPAPAAQAAAEPAKPVTRQRRAPAAGATNGDASEKPAAAVAEAPAAAAAAEAPRRRRAATKA